MDYEKNQGPLIQFDKSYLCMMTEVCKIKQDQVKITNTGSTTVTYEWKKIERGDYIPSKNSDGMQRFYCHYPRDSLKPGEQKTFIFSFRSTKPGMFNEEWELLTEPQLLETAPLLNLSGMATKNDDFVERRDELNEAFQAELQNLGSGDAMDDIVDVVKSPPNLQEAEMSLPDKFESDNEHLGLYYTQGTYENLVQLYNLVVRRLQIQGDTEPIEEFETDVEYIEELITRIRNPMTQESLQRKYVDIFYQAKRVPVTKAKSYDIFRAMVLNFSEDVIEVDERARKELGIVENMGFEVVPEEQTEEEAAAIAEELKNRKLEAAKRNKQKVKTDEEEAADQEALINKIATDLGQTLSVQEDKVSAVEKEIELIKTRWLMQNHQRMDADQYDAINRKLSIYDIELGALDIVLRLDLDIPLSKFVPPPKIQETASIGKSVEGPAGASVGKDSKLNAKKSELESVVSASPLGQEEDYWKQRQILDHSWVKKTVAELRKCTEGMANRVFILGNLGEKSGRIHGENSMKIIQNELQQHIPEVQILFLNDANKSDFAERKAQDEFADNCIYVVENLNFQPEEFGYIEPLPEVKPEAENAEEEKKEEPPKDDSKKLRGGKKEDTSKNESQKVVEEVIETPVVEEEEKEPEEPPFTSHTIHQFKKNLAQLGDIYVHDAPLASLTNSNTQSEIKCPKKVMGMKMTEEMRNIAQFFMKIYPLDIDSIYHNMPDRSLEYYTFRSTAVIGGVAKTTQEILEKILLANSFLDTFEQIFLVGEIGLAAIGALGIYPGCVERSSSNVEEYETMKEFFIKLFNKSIIKGCQIKLPVDFIVSAKVPLEQIIQENASKVRSGSNPNPEGNQGTGELQTQGSRQSNPDIGVSEVQKITSGNEIINSGDGTLKPIIYDNNFKPTHWTDAQIFYEQTTQIDLELQIQKAFNNVTMEARKTAMQLRSNVVSSANNLKIAEQSINDLGSMQDQMMASAENVASKEGTNDEAVPDQEDGGDEAKEPCIPEDNWVIQLGPKTVFALQKAINLSFKLFWDGSVCMFRETVLSSANNKHVLNTLLELRTKTNDQQEPPVTLLHGQETEQVLRNTLMRIKIEQQEALDAKKRAAQENVPDEDEEELEDDDAMDLADESEEKISTFQEDLEIITDFSCFSSTEFTTKIMQGVKTRAMMSFGAHKKPTKEQQEEDLSILDEI